MLGNNNCLAPHLHTVGVNHGLLWKSDEWDTAEEVLKSAVGPELSARSALHRVVYGTFALWRSNTYSDWELQDWAPAGSWPWLSDRARGDWAIRERD